MGALVTVELQGERNIVENQDIPAGKVEEKAAVTKAMVDIRLGAVDGLQRIKASMNNYGCMNIKHAGEKDA